MSFASLAVHVGVLPGLDIRSRRCVEPPGAAPSLDVAPLNMKQLLIGVGWLFLGAIVLFGWPLRSDRPRATADVTRDAMPLPRPSVEESFLPGNAFSVSSAVAAISGEPASAPLATRVVARAIGRPGLRCPRSQGREHLSCARARSAPVTKKLATSGWQSGRSVSKLRVETL